MQSSPSPGILPSIRYGSLLRMDRTTLGFRRTYGAALDSHLRPQRSRRNYGAALHAASHGIRCCLQLDDITVVVCLVANAPSVKEGTQHLSPRRQS